MAHYFNNKDCFYKLQSCLMHGEVLMAYDTKEK